MSQSTFSTQHNIIIKHAIPAMGIVNSNPERCKRLAAHFLQDGEQVVNSWGVGVFTGKVAVDGERHELFFAYAPMGGSGSGIAFHEMFAAGAKTLVRQGSNDVWVTEDDLDDAIVVSEARGLRGISWDQGVDEHQIDTPTLPDEVLQQHIEIACQEHSLNYSNRTCFNVDDYHAYLYPEHTPQPDRIRHRLAHYEQFSPYCRDMETASLFLKAQQFGASVASVLQNVIKQKPGAPYEGRSGEQARVQERRIADVIINALIMHKTS